MKTTTRGEKDRRIRELERQVIVLQSKLDAFFTGDVPQNASLDHMILAKAGRVRLQERAKQAALLTKPV